MRSCAAYGERVPNMQELSTTSNLLMGLPSHELVTSGGKREKISPMDRTAGRRQTAAGIQRRPTQSPLFEWTVVLHVAEPIRRLADHVS